MTAHPAAAVLAEPDAELPEPPFAPALVEELVRQLGKAVRTHQLYLPNNPIYQRALDGARAVFAPVWSETTELVLAISETEFRWAGRAVLQESSRGESLPWLFYKDGIRELTILQGFEGEELGKLLGVLQRVRTAATDEDDLLTLLWEQEFAYLRYRFIDVGTDAGPPIEASEQSTTARTVATVREEVESDGERPKSIISMEEFDAALYFLDEAEVEYLKSAIASEARVDLRRNVIDMLLDIFEVQQSAEVRDEICGMLDSLTLHLLASGEYGAVAHLLREAQAAGERAPEVSPAHRQRLAQLADGLSSEDVLPQLLQALDESATIPAQEELDALFLQLRPSMLGIVLGRLGDLQNAQLRATLEAAATRLAAANVNEIVKLIGSPDPVVAREAVRRAGELKTPAAVGALGRVLVAPDPAMRLAATQALAEIGSPGALRLLEQALDDDERDVRIVAVRAVAARAHRAALPRVEGVVSGRGVRNADLTEKMAYFEAFGALAGDSGVDQLDALLNERRLLAFRAAPEIRACAALALGRIGSERALAALGRAAGDKDVRVRSAINKALRGGAT